jgi:hypothetical protein
VKSVILKANQEVSRENLRAARICEGKERKCANGSRAGLVLPSCELVCPEDNRKDLSCYQGMAEDQGEYEYSWVEREVPGTPVIHSAGGAWHVSDTPALNCTVFEIVNRPAIPADAFRRPASHKPQKVRDAR